MGRPKYKFEHETNHNIRVNLKKCKDAKTLKRLQALDMYRRGKTNVEISEAIGYSITYISTLIKKVRENGISAVLEDRRTTNNRRMSFEEETQFLEEFIDLAESGQVITVQGILGKFEEITGKPSASSTIYDLLHRHGWRKVRPRPRHPGAASEEDINSSKKLNLSWQKT